MTPCSVCQGPFHPATGSEFKSSGRWCGPCTRDFIKFLKTQQGRRWGKVPFYAHACPPPAVSRFCECRVCCDEGMFVPRACGGSFGVRAGTAGFAGSSPWEVVGPMHGCEHVAAIWGCASEAEAIALAERLGGGWVPPATDTCDGCKRDFPVEVLTSRDTKMGQFAFCPTC